MGYGLAGHDRRTEIAAQDMADVDPELNEEGPVEASLPHVVIHHLLCGFRTQGHANGVRRDYMGEKEYHGGDAEQDQEHKTNTSE